MLQRTIRPTLFLVSEAAAPCGVEDFARKMLGALQKYTPDGGNDLLAISGRWASLPSAFRKMERAERIVFNFPMVAWKRSILIPWCLLLFAYIRGQDIFVFLHEWTSLHPLRRLVLFPFIVLSKTIIVLSPYIRDQLASDRWVGWAKRKCVLGLHAPTVKRPDGRVFSGPAHPAEWLQARKNSLVIGQFGSIYKGKGTDALLDVCTHLRRRGIDASVIFIGGITKSLDDYETSFWDRVKALKLQDRVTVTGYVDSEEELFAIFDRVRVFLYIFPEGLTARRSSVLASVQSGRPVVVSEPTVKGEFAHHRGYTGLIESGALTLLPSSATVEDTANLILSRANQPVFQAASFDYERWWLDAARNADRILKSRSVSYA